MWGNNKKSVKMSAFFEGDNIFDKLTNSTFGKVMHTFYELFSQEEIIRYTLPKLIVIGNESSGKSSVLENLTKLQLFPRDREHCTKCPIIVKLFNGNPKYTVQYIMDNKQIINEVMNKNDIYTVISEYMRTLPTGYISDQEITVSITDRDMLPLELIDLPGIQTYPQDLAIQSIELCKKYLNDPHTIILCVIPATTSRLSACQSIALIREMKMEGNCVLVLTMADSIQIENIEDLLIRRITGISDEINDFNFSCAVINRTHYDTHSLEENDICEIKWFDDQIFRYIPQEYIEHLQLIKDNITITSLITNVNRLYTHHIETIWKPSLLNDIRNKLLNQMLRHDTMWAPITENNLTELNELIGRIVQSCSDNYPCVLISDDIQAIDKQADVSEFERACKYHTLIDVVDKLTQQYNLLDICTILLSIENHLYTEKKYNMKRFESIYCALSEDLHNRFNILSRSTDLINRRMKKYILDEYMKGSRMVSIDNILENMQKMYRLFVVYPLITQINKFTCSDFEESDTYICQRNKLMNDIDRTLSHYNAIHMITSTDHKSCESDNIELDLSDSGIVDVSALGGVYQLGLSGCTGITDVSALGGVHQLDLRECSGIVDVSALGGVHTLLR